MKTSEVPAELIAILDRYAGKEHSQSGSVVTALAEILTVHAEMLGAQHRATRTVLAERERELLLWKGPCSNFTCRLHYAHAGPCDCD